MIRALWKIVRRLSASVVLLAAAVRAAEPAPSPAPQAGFVARTNAANHTVRVGKHNGRTVILVDDQPIPGVAMLAPLRAREDKASSQNASLEAGMRILLVWAGGDWRGPNDWRLEETVRSVEQAAKLAPEVWLLPRICLNAPPWWLQHHPEECARNADSTGPEPYASMASPVWIKDSSAYLAALVRALEASAAGPRILGYLLMTGHGGEWIYLGAGAGRLGDYSQPSLQYYRRWLRNKYGPQPWIEKIQIPSEADRLRSLPALLRDPKADARAIDFDLAFSDMTLDHLLAWCRTVKQETGGRRLVGAFYGYLLWQTGLVNAAVPNGHLALRRLIESPDIDFVTAFPSYDVREPGAAAPLLLPVESIQAAGKLVFNECDDRTHLSGAPPPLRLHLMRDQRDPANGPPLWSGCWNIWPLEDQQQALSVVRREFAQHLIRGAAYWWFDMGTNWYATPEFTGEFRKQQAIAEQALAWDLGSSSQVAGVVCGASPAAHSQMRMFDVDPQASFVELNADMSTREMYKAGTPIDWWMSEDLARPEMRQYKALYFHNATVLDARQRQALEALKGDGRALIFVGYPGLVAGGALEAQAASDTVGIRLKLVTTRAAARLPIKDYNLPCTLEAPAQIVLGGGVIVAPRLIVDDPQARIIACWPDGAPAAAMKRHPGWTAYYFPVPPNNAYVFRGIFRDAGCHIYTHNTCRDVVYANRSLLAIHSVHYGQPVYLPAPARVTDLFTGAVVVEKGDRINLGRAWDWLGGTHLFRVEYISPGK